VEVRTGPARVPVGDCTLPELIEVCTDWHKNRNLQIRVGDRIAGIDAWRRTLG
jgi:hypothetical protein